jgi:esterase FrsA
MQLKNVISWCLAVTFFITFPALSQIKDRNIDEIKEEALYRAENGGAYPLIGLEVPDVKEALSLIKTRSPDEWASAWSKVADKYMQQAQQASSPEQASILYKKAWRLYFFAQWPAPTSKGKMQAYNKALDAYLKYAKNFDPPLQVIKIPFEGKEIVGYLRLPKEASSAKPVPMIFAVSGLDSRKETVADSYAQILNKGIGIFVLDGPGTGQAPIKVSPTAERMFSVALDYLTKRPEVDAKRIIFSGVSFGAYWATKMAIIEKDRLLGSVAQSPPVHDTFQANFVEKKLSTPEYLFDYLPATINVYEGVTNLEQLLSYVPKMSLKEQNLLQKPTTKMLVLGGANDTQVLLSDIKMLMDSGDVPKDFWINPKGGHLGRQVKGWTDANIFSKVIIPWELRLLEESGWKR